MADTIPKDILNNLLVGDSATLMKRIPDESVDLIVTSPPYWSAVEYTDDLGWETYTEYLEMMNRVWRECSRVLRPNGKLCINSPLMPIPKSIIMQHTRHVKNIAFDIEHEILNHTPMERYSLFVWQKQTSKLMFGSYPYPGNLLENNTIEFINVYVKPGKPPKFAKELKEANKISRQEWVDLIQQIWFMYPEDIKRNKEHPAPFPEKLPARLMKLYTYGAALDFPGEVVLDPFVGTGTTCAVAKSMGRQFIGIDLSKQYIEFAEQRVASASLFEPLLLVGRGKYPGKKELIEMARTELETNGSSAEKQHKIANYGRSVSRPPNDQFDLKL